MSEYPWLSKEEDTVLGMTQSSTQIIIGNDRKRRKKKQNKNVKLGDSRDNSGPARILAGRGIIKSCVECMLVTCRDYDPLESETQNISPFFFFFSSTAGGVLGRSATGSCEPVS